MLAKLNFPAAIRRLLGAKKSELGLGRRKSCATRPSRWTQREAGKHCRIALPRRACGYSAHSGSIAKWRRPKRAPSSESRPEICRLRFNPLVFLEENARWPR